MMDRAFTEEEINRTGAVLKFLTEQFRGPADALPTMSVVIAYLIDDLPEERHEEALEITDRNTRQALKCVRDSCLTDNVVPLRRH